MDEEKRHGGKYTNWITNLLRTTPNQWLDENGAPQEKEGSSEPSNFDLFYDLVLVVAYQTIGNDFKATEPRASDFVYHPVAEMIAFVMPVFFLSLGLCNYSNRFGHGERSSTIVFYLFNFILLALLASNISQCTNDEFADKGTFYCSDFSLFYSLSRLVLALVWLRVAIFGTHQRGRAFSIWQTVHHALITILWFIMIFLQTNYYAITSLWWTAITLDFLFLVVPFILPLRYRAVYDKSYIPINAPLFDERMSSITLMGLGEAVATSGISIELNDEPRVKFEKYLLRMFVVGTTVVLLLAFLRISSASLVEKKNHALQKSRFRGLCWTLSQLPIIFFLLLEASVSEQLFRYYYESTFIMKALYGISIGGTFITGAVIQSLHYSNDSGKRVSKMTRMLARWLAGCLIVGCAFLPSNGPLPIAGGIFVIALVAILADQYMGDYVGVPETQGAGLIPISSMILNPLSSDESEENSDILSDDSHLD